MILFLLFSFVFFSMDLDLIDKHLPKLCFHNEDTDKLMYNKALSILSVKHSVLFCKLYQLFLIFYVEYGQGVVFKLTLSQ